MYSPFACFRNTFKITNYKLQQLRGRKLCVVTIFPVCLRPLSAFSVAFMFMVQRLNRLANCVTRLSCDARPYFPSSGKKILSGFYCFLLGVALLLLLIAVRA
jgi:hypothetical protein